MTRRARIKQDSAFRAAIDFAMDSGFAFQATHWPKKPGPYTDRNSLIFLNVEDAYETTKHLESKGFDSTMKMEAPNLTHLVMED